MRCTRVLFTTLSAGLAGSMITAAGDAAAANAARGDARLGAPASECALFRNGFEFLDSLFWNGFDRSGHMSPGSGNGEPIGWLSSGGYTIRIDRHTLTITDPSGRNSVQHWGDPHENLNGKHIKDWGGAPGWDEARRSLLLGDGTKVTLNSTGAQGVILAISIYDGHQELHVVSSTNTVRYHGIDPVGTRCRDAQQHDGETALFSTDASTGVASYRNVYNENAGFDRVETDVPLGTTGGFANPNQVNDLFDDPRLAHT